METATLQCTGSVHDDDVDDDDDDDTVRDVVL